MKRFLVFLFSLSSVFCFAQPSTISGNAIQLKKSINTLPKSPEKVVMYEVFVRNFSKEGTFNGVTARLKELKDMGVNMLWLMPVQPTGIENRKGTYGSPYAIKDYTAVHPDYGTNADFKRLVDSCHSLGLNIIIDLVANHTAWDHNWVQQHPDWYTYDSTGKKIVPPVADWTDVADLNYDNKDMQEEMIKAMKYWIKEFNIDGYRCDVAEMVPHTFWKRSIDSLRKMKRVVMLAEGADEKLIEDGFNITYGWEFYHTLKKVFKGERPTTSLDSVLAKEDSKFPPKARMLRFITNHDENSWDNTPQNLFGGVAACKAAYLISVMVKGVPLMYNGQEVAYPERINLFEKYVIDYDKNHDLKNFYGQINSIHHNSPAVIAGTMKSINVNKNVYAFVRELGEQKIAVFVNTTGSEITYPKPGILNKGGKVLLGENLSDDTTQKLPAFGFQVIKL